MKDEKIRHLEQDLGDTQQQYAECYDEVSSHSSLVVARLHHSDDPAIRQ